MSFRTKTLFLLAVAVLTVSTSFGIAHAQSIPAMDNINLTPSTNNPIPGQQITITAASYGTDINSATITWSVGGKIVQQGIGLTSLDITAPTSGKTLVVKVSAVTPQGAGVSGSITIGSGSVDMVIEPGGYVPPSFPGKTPLAYQNTYKVVAVPHLFDTTGKEYDPRTLEYQWRKDDGTVIQDQSGYGKQAATLTGNIIPRAFYLIVDVSSRDNKSRAEGIIQINAVSPSLNFYNNDPLYGPLLNKAISDNVYIGSQKEYSVIAVPFGFDKPKNSVGDLSFNWSVNGESQSTLVSNDSIILRTPDNTVGSSNIDLIVKNTHQILQGTSAGFSATFGTTKQTSMAPASSIFGIPVANAAEYTSYTVLSPLPCIEAKGAKCSNGNLGLQPTVQFSGYLQSIINLMIALAAVAAVFMITYGGFQYVTSSIMQTKNAGLATFKNAVLGLVLVLCSYLIVSTINPNFVKIDTSLVTPLKVAPGTTAWSTYYNNVQAMTAQSAATRAQNDQINQQITAQQTQLNNLQTQRATLPDGSNTNAIDQQIAQTQQTIQDNENKVNINTMTTAANYEIAKIKPDTKPDDILLSAMRIDSIQTDVLAQTAGADAVTKIDTVRDDAMLQLIQKYTAYVVANPGIGNYSNMSKTLTPYLPTDPNKALTAITTIQQAQNQVNNRASQPSPYNEFQVY